MDVRDFDLADGSNAGESMAVSSERVGITEGILLSDEGGPDVHLITATVGTRRKDGRLDDRL